MKKSEVLSLIIFLSLFIYLYGCSSSENFTKWDIYEQRINKEFKNAYSAFENKDYKSAKENFISYNVNDSNVSNFESYAFLAECYKQLGNVDSGKLVYIDVIKKIKDQRGREVSGEKDDDFRLDTLQEWSNNYPEFPTTLMKGNGFVPFNVMPEVIQAEAPVYPEDAKIDGVDGDVFVKILLDEKGLPISASIAKSTNPIFNDASIAAAKESKFTPLKRKGTLEKCYVMIPFRFRLHK